MTKASRGQVYSRKVLEKKFNNFALLNGIWIWLFCHAVSICRDESDIPMIPTERRVTLSQALLLVQVDSC